ncbi:GH39 family glycosyl hydrolase [Anaerocolumna jejuensis]|uniref:GH39 family glycosyl hydrolase n=1 Tax=Anaerocolumna jejuensis TaxID=259063 RepID=UPI003F7C73CC
MDNIPSMSKNIFALNVTVQKYVSSYFHDNIELYYILEGTLKLIVEDEVFSLKQDDFVIINAGKRHSYTASENLLLGIFTISYSKLCDMLQQSFLVFWCNSVIDRSEAYEDARKTILNIINQYFGNRMNGSIYLTSQFYYLLHILTSNFMLNPKDKYYEFEKSQTDTRFYEIIHYVQANYCRDIRLSDLSNKLYLSNAYLSKYIKKQLGISFIHYLNQTRLQHAVQDLLYNNTSIMRVALDNGFPNVAAFNKAFKKAYLMTPSAYQKKFKNTDGGSIKQSEADALIQERLYEYFEKTPGIIPDSYMDQDIFADVSIPENYQKNWNKMINIGAASDLLKSDMQEHVLMLRNKLQFQYIRFWAAFSPEMYINIKAGDKHYNFGRLDRVLDFLVNNGIKPYMEMGYKPKKLLRNLYSVLIKEEVEFRLDDLEEMENFINAFIKHLINRYGIEELETWYFEIWKEEVELDQTICSEEVNEKYFRLFDTISRTMKKYSPNFRIGGAGLGIRFGKKKFKDILSNWKANHSFPDFLTLYCYPYILGEVEGEQISKHSTDRSYMKNQLVMAKELMEEINFHVPELHVTEWNSTVSNRNVLNDHCNKGAYIMKNVINSIGLADLTGYWLGSDLFADYYDSQAVLNGGCGLITKEGILKPAFYAMDFLNKSGKQLIQKGENYLLTYCGHSNYSIVCHNYKQCNYSYFLHKEDEISIKEINQMFIDRDKIHLSFHIQNIKNGKYQIKIHSINQYYGSVQDEWVRMDLIEANKEEIEYLKRVCTPRLSVIRCEVNDNILHVEATLESNEIQYIKIMYQY